MILHFPDLDLKIEKTSAGRRKLPDGEWMVLPSRSTFLVPLTLPARVIRGASDKQLEDLAFDRIPLPAGAGKSWTLVPHLGFLSRGSATAFAAIAPLESLPADFEQCFPADLLLGAMVWDTRFAKGGCIALDTPACLTLIGVGPRAKTILVWKHMMDATGRPPVDLSPSISGLFGRGSTLLRLNAGGGSETLLGKYGTVVTEDASTALCNCLLEIIR